MNLSLSHKARSEIIADLFLKHQHRQALLTDYYTARWRYHLAADGCKTGWQRKLRDAHTALLKAGIAV